MHTAQVELVMNFTSKRLSKGGTVRTKKKTMGKTDFLQKASPSLLRAPGEVGSGLSILTTEISIQTRRKVL